MRWWRKKSELDAEIEAHIGMAVADRVARGEDAEHARAEVEREFGNAALVKDVTREAWGWLRFERLLQDVRYALRQFYRAPGFALTTVFVLALGIGANSMIFSFLNAFLFRPPAVKDAARVVELFHRNVKESGIREHTVISYPIYANYRDHNQAFDGMMAFDADPLPMSWSNAGGGQKVYGQLVSGNFFSVLGVEPVRGRTFLPEEDRVAGAHPVIVVSHSFWQQRLGADDSAVGRTMVLNGTAYTLVGVAPPNFSGIMIGIRPDFWTPLAMAPLVRQNPTLLESKNSFWLFGAGRLKPGVTTAQAQADLVTLWNTFAKDPAEPKDQEPHLFPLNLTPGPFRNLVGAFVGLLMAAVGMVLLIACANAANLLLARGVTRRHELAVRAALGAGRGRLIQQTLTESLLLALAGGAGGLLLTLWTVPLLLRLKPPSLPLSIDAPLDWRIVCFTLAISIGTGVVFGIVPALRNPRRDIVPSLRDDAKLVGQRKSWLRDVLVVAQVTVCLVLLIGAGLCVRSLMNARSIDPGFDIHGLVLAELDPGSLGYSDARAKDFYQQLQDRVKGVPGVTVVSIANYLPLGSTMVFMDVEVEGYKPPPGARSYFAQELGVRPDFFRAMGTPLLAGRDFTPHDNDAKIHGAVINAAMAHQFWPKGDALGQHFTSDHRSFEVIGLVKTGKYRSLGEDPQPFFYTLMDTSPHATLVVRSQGDAGAVLAAIRREVRGLDPNIVPIDMETMTQYMALPLFPAHTTGVLLAAFGAVALILAVAGMYGVISYSVNQRRHEIGLRMALGADKGNVLRLVLRQGMRLTLIGVVLGLGLSFAATRVLSGLLYGIKATDPVTFSGIAVLLIVVALLSCYLPARRAARVQPMEALRTE